MMRHMTVMIVAGLIVGCGGVSDAPPLAPVSGTVTMGGKPVADATVGFHLDGDGAPRAGTGTTDENGKFRISTFNTNDGAIIGTHIVTVAKIQADPAEAGDMEIGGDAYGAAMMAAAKGTAPKQIFPTKYATKDTSPLKATVTEAGNDDVQLDLE